MENEVYSGDRLEPRPEVVEDAVILLDYAIEKGLVHDRSVIDSIRKANKQQTIEECGEPGVWAGFDAAYSRLARKMTPVTARSLRATAIPESDKERGSRTLLQWFLGKNKPQRSEAHEFSMKLWEITFVAVGLVILGEAFEVVSNSFISIGVKTDAELFSESNRTVSILTVIIKLSLPFAYGALGACAFLLRRCHLTIHKRTFDPLRQSEFLNRILLGIVSGSAAGLLLGENITGVVEAEIGQAALAFIAGYNTDFLFTAIERIMAAVLPKVEAQHAGALPEATQPLPKSDGSDKL